MTVTFSSRALEMVTVTISNGTISNGTISSGTISSAPGVSGCAG